MKQYWSMTEGVFNCLADRHRTHAFARAIRSAVTRGCIVADLGSGSGIMALLAAKAGAKRVYAVENDAKNAQWLETTFKSNGFGDVIEVIQADARKVKLPGKVDVIICEMIATGLIEELQIPVMNHALSFARKGVRVVLERIENYVEAVEVDDRFYGFRLPVPQYDYPGEDLVRVRALTPKHLYREVDFTRKNATRVDVAVTLPVRCKARRAKINAIRITNRTGFCDGSSFGASLSYCFPVILPVAPLAVKIGDKVAIKLSYDMCCGFSTLRVAATQV
jgi:predicted RNA methylase